MRTIAGIHHARAFLYARVSTRGQADNGVSLDTQQCEGQAFCRAEGYPAPEMRIEVESGGAEKLEQRTELMRLLAEIRPGDVLVCYDLARWSRDQVFAVDSIRKLRDRGIMVRFWRQPFLDRKPPGSGGSGGGVPVDLTGIIAWAAENERHQTRERSMSNRRALRASGAFVEGNPPFGYTVQDRKLIPVPEHVPIVVRIFTDSYEGISARRIADALRVEHPRIVVGREKKHVMTWTVNTVLKILRNRLYTGYMETCANGRKKRNTPGSGQWIKSHEAIISPAMFEQVSRGLTARQRAGRSVATSLTAGYLLKGVAVCAVCGNKVRGLADLRVKGGGYYQCAKRNDPTKYKDRTPCSNKTLARWREADAAAESLIVARLDSLASALAAVTTPPQQPVPDWKRLAAEIAEARAKVVRLVVNGIITESDAATHLTELKRDEEALEARRVEHERQAANNTEETRRTAFAKLTEYRDVWTRLSIIDRRELARELVESIRITTMGEVEVAWRPVAEVAGAIGTPSAQSAAMSVGLSAAA
jgi:DNA invertase Pin-like site-specific DNA recombinase